MSTAQFPTVDPPFMDLLYDGRETGKRAHAVITSTGEWPRPGLGWRTACGQYWADGERTAPSMWSFAATCITQRCRLCLRTRRVARHG